MFMKSHWRTIPSFNLISNTQLTLSMNHILVNTKQKFSCAERFFIQSSKIFHGETQNLDSAWWKEFFIPYILHRLGLSFIYCKTWDTQGNYLLGNKLEYSMSLTQNFNTGQDPEPLQPSSKAHSLFPLDPLLYCKLILYKWLPSKRLP